MLVLKIVIFLLILPFGVTVIGFVIPELIRQHYGLVIEINDRHLGIASGIVVFIIGCVAVSGY